MTIKRILVTLGIALLAIFSMGPQTATVSADGGPHGGYRDVTGGLTDACAGCHRVHQGKSEGKLLKAESQYALCLTCHNGAGTILNVLDGVKQTTGSLESMSGTIPRGTASNMYTSVTPYGDARAMPDTGEATFTVRVRNTSGGLLDASLACSGGTCSTVANPDTSLDLTGIAADGLGYGTVKVTAGAVTTTVSTTITITGTQLPTITYATQTANFTVGKTVTGATSAATGIIRADNDSGVTGTLTLGSVTGTFVSGETITDNNTTPGSATTSSALQTYTATNVALVVTTKAEASISGATLNGGGFRFVNGAQTTSRHNANPADNSLRPWGYGGDTTSTYLTNASATNNTGGINEALAAPLQCTSCHNPHGTKNYRLLKEKINGVSVRVRAYYDGAFTKDEGGAGQQAGVTSKYAKEYYGSSATADANNTSPTLAANTGDFGIATLCGACHTAYPSAKADLSLTAPALPTLAFDGQTTNFVVGEKVTAGTASGYIVDLSDQGATGLLTLRAVSGTFADNAALTGETSGGNGAVNGTLQSNDSVHYRHRTEMPYTNWTNPETGATSVNPETAPLDPDGVGPLPVWEPLRLASSTGAGVGNNTVVVCLTCHRVHGTASTMTGYALKKSQDAVNGKGDEDLTPSQGVKEPDGTVSLSTLLYTDNRGMCEACHQW